MERMLIAQVTLSAVRTQARQLLQEPRHSVAMERIALVSRAAVLVRITAEWRAGFREGWRLLEQICIHVVEAEIVYIRIHWYLL